MGRHGAAVPVLLLSWIVFLASTARPTRIQILRWIESGTLFTDWAIRLDRLTAIMLIVITTVSALVHLYSFGYMAHDDNFREGESYRPRFFAYLSFFTFAMLMLVTADNLVQMFFGWEGRGRRLLPADRVLLPQALGQCRRDQGLRRQPGRRFRLPLGIFALFFLTDSIEFDVIFDGPRAGRDQITFLWPSGTRRN
jgi:NADH-quinone oxidoreductase subunit L